VPTGADPASDHIVSLNDEIRRGLEHFSDRIVSRPVLRCGLYRFWRGRA
jgi:hypothetical protein